MKKVLILTDYYEPHKSGIVTIINQIKERLNERDIKIIILTGKLNPSEKKFTRINKNLLIIKSKRSFNLSRGFYSFSMVKDFFFISKKVDTINIHFPISIIFPILFLTRKPFITNYHCNPPFKLTLIDIIIYLYFYIFGILTIIKSYKICILTKDYFKNMLFFKLFRNKIHEVRPYSEIINFNSIKNNYVLEKDKIPIIGYLGRISEEKGLLQLISASSMLSNEGFNHKLIIAGNFKDNRFLNYINKIKIESQKNNFIYILESISENEKKEFYKKINILILPSINSFEAFGLVQLEAMSAGNLVISTNLKGVRMPINKTNNGKIINNPRDIYEIAQVIKATSKVALNTRQNDIIKNLNIHFNKKKYQKKIDLIFN